MFHAAAYKHVGLMESNPVEAVRNNAIATRVVAHVAGQLAARRFVLVSTDKAVAPATVMGASKALAEFALDAAAARWAATRYRRGALRQRARLLRQRGPDLRASDRAWRPGDRHRRADDPLLHDDPRGGPADHPLWLADLRAGRRGTDREWIPPPALSPPAPSAEVCGAEVFVLDMGEPVRIVELARAMIDLSGLDPDRDIDIEIIGRRAGEKLTEELFNDYERALPTPAEKIMLAERPPLGAEAVESMFAEIGLLVLEGDAAGLAAKVSALSAAHGGGSTGAAGAAHGGGPADGGGVVSGAGPADRGGVAGGGLAENGGGHPRPAGADKPSPAQRRTPEPLVHSQDS